jgi:hypothetical protein
LSGRRGAFDTSTTTAELASSSWASFLVWMTFPPERVFGTGLLIGPVQNPLGSATAPGAPQANPETAIANPARAATRRSQTPARIRLKGRRASIVAGTLTRQLAGRAVGTSKL